MFLSKNTWKRIVFLEGSHEYTQPEERNYIRRVQVIKNLFYIVRWPNLLMLAGIQTLVYFRLLDPLQSELKWPAFLQLAFITILLGAGGYVINDYYDVDNDKINKPEKMIAGKQLSLYQVRMFYFFLVSLGAVGAVILASELGLMTYLFIYPIAVAGLWFYSYALKCKPVAGNIWVSLFCAGVISIVALPDIFLHHAQSVHPELWNYMSFAFLSTWYREVVKDLEDKEGDELASCKTFVVRYGIPAGKKMAAFLGIALLVSLAFWESGQTTNWVNRSLPVIQGFTIASLALMWWAKNSNYYHHASNVIKFVMIMGTALLFVI